MAVRVNQCGFLCGTCAQMNGFIISFPTVLCKTFLIILCAVRPELAANGNLAGRPGVIEQTLPACTPG